MKILQNTTIKSYLWVLLCGLSMAVKGQYVGEVPVTLALVRDGGTSCRAIQLSETTYTGVAFELQPQGNAPWASLTQTAVGAKVMLCATAQANPTTALRSTTFVLRRKDTGTAISTITIVQEPGDNQAAAPAAVPQSVVTPRSTNTFNTQNSSGCPYGPEICGGSSGGGGATTNSSCFVNFASNTNAFFDHNAQSRTYTLVYSGGCTSSSVSSFTFTTSSGAPLPSWISASKVGGNVRVTLTRNNASAARTIVMLVRVNGYSGNLLGIAGTQISQSCQNQGYWYIDRDGDGYGDQASQYYGCRSQGATNHIAQGGDCDDDNANINPTSVWYKDGDNDGFASITRSQCSRPSGTGWTLTVKPLGDCNDGNAGINPNTYWYRNNDGDGFAAERRRQCGQPSGSGWSITVRPLGDCNDNNAAIHPNTIWYGDGDNDGYEASRQQCTAPTGYQLTPTGLPTGDCDDADASERPGAVWYSDSDGDGFRDPDYLLQTLTQCNRPSGGPWTTNSGIDRCPTQANTSNQGCPTSNHFNCNGTVYDPDVSHSYIDLDQSSITMPSGGGDNSVTISFYQYPRTLLDCPVASYDLFLEVPTWVSYSIQPNNRQIDLTVQSNNSSTESRNTQLKLYVNGVEKRTIAVTQDGNNNNGGGGNDGCTVSRSLVVNGVPQSDSALVVSETGSEIVVTYTFSEASCMDNLRLVDLQRPVYNNGEVNFEGLPSGIPVTELGFTATTRSFRINVPFNELEGRTFIVAAASDTDQRDALNPNTIRIYGDPFQLSQATCAYQWYYDSDKDGLGDYGAPPVIACFAPGPDWYNEALDRCPNKPGTAALFGCPPESDNWNTVTSRGFDLANAPKTADKQYFDDLGKLVQQQSWDVATNERWASQTLYDLHGQPALSTLSAPIGNDNTFLYQKGLAKTTANQTYSLYDFEFANKAEPLPLGSAENSIGWYYSEQNNKEAYQDVTDYPFVRSVYSELNPGTVLSTLGGNKVDTDGDGTVDGWAQAYSFTMPASDELGLGVAFGNFSYYSLKTTKTVTRDVHGNENVIFTDTDGKVLAAARSGTGGTTSNPMSIAIGEQGFVDIHIPEGITGFSTSNNSALTVYDLITETEKNNLAALPPGFYRVAVTNPESYIHNSISVSYRVNYYDYTLNEYDEADRLVKSYQPLGNSKANKPFTTYDYNSLGQLIRTHSTDEGQAEFIYREDGQIRFSQNSEQAKVNEVSFTDYDPQGRPVESGVMTNANFSTLNGTSASGSQKKEQQKTYYDFLPQNSGITSVLPTGYQNPAFLSGNVAVTERDNGDYRTFYSYDVYGRVAWLVQYIAGLGTKTMDYGYHPVTGLVTEVTYQKDQADQWIHRYSYNARDQLSKVETSANSSTYT
ncbi:MAG: hypothetical protein AAGF77_06945, partial [Bacteroidota bacterium]